MKFLLESNNVHKRSEQSIWNAALHDIRGRRLYTRYPRCRIDSWLRETRKNLATFFDEDQNIIDVEPGRQTDI